MTPEHPDDLTREILRNSGGGEVFIVPLVLLLGIKRLIDSRIRHENQ